METRDAKQVKKFSGTVMGLRHKPSRILTKGYLSLAAGFQVVAEELRANNPVGLDLERNDESSDEDQI